MYKVNIGLYIVNKCAKMQRTAGRPLIYSLMQSVTYQWMVAHKRCPFKQPLQTAFFFTFVTVSTNSVTNIRQLKEILPFMCSSCLFRFADMIKDLI